MPTIGFSHYNLTAPRALLEELRTFYCGVVGLSVGPRPPFQSFGYWLYADKHDVLHLTESAPERPKPGAPATTFDHAAFTCTGRVEFEHRLALLGMTFQLVQVPETGQVQLFLHDPAGNGVELNFSNAAA